MYAKKDFSISDLDNEKKSFQAYRGRVITITTWMEPFRTSLTDGITRFLSWSQKYRKKQFSDSLLSTSRGH